MEVKVEEKSLRSHSLKSAKTKGESMISNKSNQHLINEVLEDFAATDLRQLKESLEKLYNQLMVAEREDYINAAPYERTSDRRGYCNGFKNKKLLTRSGELALQVPQVREGHFYPSCLEKGEKVEQALKACSCRSLCTRGINKKNQTHYRRTLWQRDLVKPSFQIC